MKWAYQVKDKAKAVALLGFIIAVIVYGNFSYRKDFSKLNTSISSIYKDRLMPATYIYDITGHLYEKRLLNEHRENHAQHALAKQMLEHDKAISTIIASYEKTYLTTAEKELWQEFKQRLNSYNSIYMQMPVADNNLRAQAHYQNLLDDRFNETLHSLNALKQLQVGEGKYLQKNSQAIINGTIFTSYLEIALLIVLGIFTMVILSVSDKTLFNKMQKQVWN